MKNGYLMDNAAVYYAIKVNGMIVSQKFNNVMMAEQAKEQLSPEAKVVAEVVTVTTDGKELLLG